MCRWCLNQCSVIPFSKQPSLYLGGETCWVLDFFNINFVATELGKFKCLCASVFYISFFLFRFSDPTGSEQNTA